MQVAAPTPLQTKHAPRCGVYWLRALALLLTAAAASWTTSAWADTAALPASATQTAPAQEHQTTTGHAPADSPAVASLPAGTVVAVPAKTAWIKFLGWSADGGRLAFRAGAAATANRPGDPCTIVRLRSGGQVAASLIVQRDITQALIDRRIHSVRSAPSEAVSERDVLLAPLDERLATVVRGSPDELAVMRRDRNGRYQPVLRHPVGASESLQAWAFGNPTGTLVAIVAEVSGDQHKSAYLFVIPTTAPIPPAGNAVQP